VQLTVTVTQDTVCS